MLSPIPKTEIFNHRLNSVVWGLNMYYFKNSFCIGMTDNIKRQKVIVPFILSAPGKYQSAFLRY